LPTSASYTAIEISGAIDIRYQGSNL
jgi:hypothetical protein